jgi:hypothetical protein
VKFTTTNNSVFEIDATAHKVRCLSGPHEAEWREYTDIIGPTLGNHCTIFWTGVKATITSAVVAIEDDVIGGLNG